MRDLNVSYYKKVYQCFLKMKPKLKQGINRGLNMLGFFLLFFFFFGYLKSLGEGDLVQGCSTEVRNEKKKKNTGKYQKRSEQVNKTVDEKIKNAVCSLGNGEQTAGDLTTRENSGSLCAVLCEHYLFATKRLGSFIFSFTMEPGLSSGFAVDAGSPLALRGRVLHTHKGGRTDVVEESIIINNF